MSSAQTPTQTVRLPAAELYWARINTAGLTAHPRAKPTRNALDFAFEESLPVLIDTLATAYVTLDDGTIVGCACPVETLAAICTRPSIVAVVPEEAPQWTGASASHCQRLNLATGRLTPPAVRHRRTRLAVVTLLLLVATSVASGVGLERRTRTAEARVTAFDAAANTLLREALPADPGTRLPPAARLTTELRKARLTRSEGGVEQPKNAAVALADLLACWPDDLPARVERLTIDGERVTLSTQADDRDGALALAAALSGGSAWEEATNRVSAARDGSVRVDLILNRTEAAP